jgi:DNA replicative helicase MCM subunit Mcm2 (Cdc46/Mcm family)
MIIDKVIAACNVCENSWFIKRGEKGEMKLPKKCPACSSPNWNRRDTRKYTKKG